MNKKFNLRIFFILNLLIISSIISSTIVLADVYINVMAVNGSDKVKETAVKYSLPGDLSSGDVLETSGLNLDYNVNDANYYVHGNITLQPKESKTFRVRVRDIWKLTPEQVESIKNEVEQGYEQIGKLKDPQQGQLLKEQLLQKLDFVQEQSGKAESVEKRIDAFRAYSKELKRIENSALAVDYWRSDPSEIKKEKIVRFNIEVENPFDKPRAYKNKSYLPSEVKPEDLVEFEGFEVRFDQEKKQAFLFKEEELQPKEKKKYTIGIRDIWFIPQKDVDYLRNRSNYAYDFLKDSKYGIASKILFDNINTLLKTLEDAQAQKKENIMEHISAFRNNQKTYDSAKTNVESLEKLLSVYREDLEKSKVQNVLQKMRSLKGVADISKAIFDKARPSEGTAWKFIGWVLIFVGFLTTINFLVWFIRSKDKSSLSKTPPQEANKDNNQQQSDSKKTT